VLNFISCNVGQKSSATDFAKKLPEEIFKLSTGAKKITARGAPGMVHHTQHARAVYNSTKFDDKQKALHKQAYQEMAGGQGTIDKEAVAALRDPLKAAIEAQKPQFQAFVPFLTEVLRISKADLAIPAGNPTNPATVMSRLNDFVEYAPDGFLGAFPLLLSVLNDATLSQKYQEALTILHNRAAKLWPAYDAKMGALLAPGGPGISLYEKPDDFKKIYNEFKKE
jgi:hypothetical protein